MVGPPPNKAGRVLLCNIILVCLCTFCVVVRLYTRLFINKTIWLDDYLATFGYLSATTLFVLCCVETKFGLGTHKNYVTENDLATFIKITLGMEIAYIFAFITTKLAFVALYLRVFPERVYRNISKILGAVLICQLIEEIVVVCVQCVPIAKLWYPKIEGSCVNMLLFLYVAFAVKLATDLVLFTLPIPLLLTLHISTGKKIGVMIMFCIGLLVCVISIIRVTFLTNTDPDITWLLVDSLNWSSVEVGGLVICSCIPTFRPLLEHSCIGRLFSFSSHGARTRTPQPLSGEQAHSHELQQRRSIARKPKTTVIVSSHNATMDGTITESQENILLKPETASDRSDARLKRDPEGISTSNRSIALQPKDEIL